MAGVTARRLPAPRSSHPYRKKKKQLEIACENAAAALSFIMDTTVHEKTK